MELSNYTYALTFGLTRTHIRTSNSLFSNKSSSTLMARPHRTLHSEASYKIFVYLRGSGIKCSLLELDLDNCMSPKHKNFHMEMLFQPSPHKIFFLSCIILGFPNSCPRCLSPKITLYIFRPLKHKQINLVI